MGEVYRARDIQLKREVAIKVLPDVFAGDPERLARFHREAQVLAAFNHPNIAHIHGFESWDGIHGLVMELVDGPTLAERIAQGPIPLAEALPIATRIAEALQAAHDRGIIHRDLKPANIKVLDDGAVKVLDFGLAKIAAPDATGVGSDLLAQSPTVTTPAVTRAGVIMGTAAYMSPEQTKGRPTDKRSDIWSFGAVLYEMLSGRRAFEGEDIPETLANVLKSEPDWNALPADVPSHIKGLVQRCLAKDRRLRIADIAVPLFVMAGDGSLASPPDAAAAAVATRPRRPLWLRLAILATALAAGGVVGGTAVWLAQSRAAAPVTRFALIQTGLGALIVDAQSRDLTITANGTHIVYKGGTRESSQLFARALDELEPTPLTAQGTPRAPFSSPDGQWIGFIETIPVTLKKVAITGGPALRLCQLDGPSRGATWGDDDSIIFATALTSTGLQRVSATGGEPTILTTPNRERGESDHLYPHFLPGSQAVLFTITSTTGGIDASQVAILDLRDVKSPPKILVRGGSQAQYVSSGHLVYTAAGTLRAVRFDLNRRETIGSAVPLISQVVTLSTGTAEFDISRDGTLIYVTGGGAASPPRTLVWVDRQGREEAIRGVPRRSYVYPRLSPDGTRVALEIRDQENDIWVWDFARETLTRVSTGSGTDETPEWMPDGRRLVFSSQTGGGDTLVRQAADGTGTAERLAETASSVRVSAVSKDGTRILFSEAGAATAMDVMMLELGERSTAAAADPDAIPRAERGNFARWPVAGL